jgi:hypothetical protein
MDVCCLDNMLAVCQEQVTDYIRDLITWHDNQPFVDYYSVLQIFHSYHCGIAYKPEANINLTNILAVGIKLFDQPPLGAW